LGEEDHKANSGEYIMSSEQNKEVIRQLFEALNDGYNLDDMAALMGDDVIVHDPMMGTVPGKAAFVQLLTVFKTAFPEHHATVHQMIAEGDAVVVQHTHVARHTGPFMGMPPTGNAINVTGLEMYRVVDGKVIEFWRHDDDAGLMRQLGLVPAPVAA
jgi:steroid delta-isomerase-like uncharacterized protein